MNEPTWIMEQVIIDLHDQQIKQHGGFPGMHDPGLLSSALAQPMNKFFYQDSPPSLFELAATYSFHLVKNHPFCDGNKRTALIATFLFLDLNGIEIAAPEHEAYLMFKALAASKATDKELTKWLVKNSNIVAE